MSQADKLWDPRNAEPIQKADVCRPRCKKSAQEGLGRADVTVWPFCTRNPGVPGVFWVFLLFKNFTSSLEAFSSSKISCQFL